MADSKEKKGGSGFGMFLLGTLATLSTGVLVKETCNKNIVDGADELYKKGRDAVKSKIADHKAKKETEKSSDEE